MLLDLDRIKSDFPILQQKVHGNRDLVYLDSAATSQKPNQVIDAISDFYRTSNGGIHRGSHALAERATSLFEKSRFNIASFIGAQANEIIFTKNATESINLVAYAFSNATSKHRNGHSLEELEKRFVVGSEDEILLTEMEHHANLIPWQELSLKTGVKLRFIPITDDGYLDLSDLENLINAKTKIVSFVHQSNILGTVNPVSEIVKRAKNVGALTLLDGCQSVPHMPVDVVDLDIDFLAFSGHKMLGPNGVGALYAKAELLDQLSVFITGGSMIEVVYLENSTYAKGPARFEAGTQSAADVVGLSAAVDYLRSVGMDSVHAHGQTLTSVALDELNKLKGVQIVGPNSMRERGSAISFTVEGIHPHDVGQFLDADGVAVRVGHHCAWPVCRRMSVPATTRASFYIYNEVADINQMVESIQKAQKFFGV
ncbi:MAG: cysteine desulfurase / selenocysteine lyase [Actinomycetota bacterium]